MTKLSSARNLTWREDRWHCAGTPIHAGCTMEMRAVETHHYDRDGKVVDDGPGEWFSVQIESSDRGQVLLAFVERSGVTFSCNVSSAEELKWPSSSK